MSSIKETKKNRQYTRRRASRQETGKCNNKQSLSNCYQAQIIAFTIHNNHIAYQTVHSRDKYSESGIDRETERDTREYH